MKNFKRNNVKMFWKKIISIHAYLTVKIKDSAENFFKNKVEKS